MNYYDEIAESYNELHSEEQNKKYQVLKSTEIISETDSIIDIAHGTGIIREIFQKNQIIGLDNSEKLLSYSNCDTIKHDFNNLPLPFKNNQFDHSICMSAIHHSNNPSSLGLEMKRISKETISISILKKSKNYDGIKNSLIDTLGKPMMEKDAYQDILLVWQI